MILIFFVFIFMLHILFFYLGRDGVGTHEQLSKVDVEWSLERLRKEISNHIAGRTIGDVDDASVYEIVGPEVTDADVPGQLGDGSSW